MNKTQQLLSFVKNGRSKRYTDIVKYICQQNGRAYSRGYYSVRLAHITHSALKLIQKNESGKYNLTSLGKMYIVDPIKAQLKARVKQLNIEIAHKDDWIKELKEEILDLKYPNRHNENHEHPPVVSRLFNYSSSRSDRATYESIMDASPDPEDFESDTPKEIYDELSRADLIKIIKRLLE